MYIYIYTHTCIYIYIYVYTYIYIYTHMYLELDVAILATGEKVLSSVQISMLSRFPPSHPSTSLLGMCCFSRCCPFVRVWRSTTRTTNIPTTRRMPRTLERTSGCLDPPMGSMIFSFRCYELTGWWFGTFFIFPYIGNNHPN